MSAAVDIPVTIARPPWTRDRVWQCHIQYLQHFPPGITVLELCAGAGTASIALKLLLGEAKVRLVGAWDLDPELQDILTFVHGPGAPLHLGAQAGNILTSRLQDFPSAHILVAGPPCPPFSACGKQLRLEDRRAKPFERCMSVISELSQRTERQGADRQGPHCGHPELLFFFLENVPGVGFKPPAGGDTPLDMFKGTLRKMLGNGWIVQHILVNSLDYGLPQSRDRVYIVGRRVKFYIQYLPRSPPHFEHQVSPSELLDLSDTQQQPRPTSLQARGLQEFKTKYAQAMANPTNKGKFAFVEIGRDPTPRTVWGSASGPTRIDRCQCLRASGPSIHVFALGEGLAPVSLDRPLRIVERGALQGFPDSIGHIIRSETAGRRIFGNAMSVPVIGSLLAAELCALQDSLSHRLLAKTISGQAMGGQPPALATVPPVDNLSRPQAWSAAETDLSDGRVWGMPDQQAAALEQGSAPSGHRAETPDRATRPATCLIPVDQIALAKRRRLSATGSSLQLDLARHASSGLGGTAVAAGTEPLPRPSELETPSNMCSPVPDSLQPGQWPAFGLSEGPDSGEDKPMAGFLVD